MCNTPFPSFPGKRRNHTHSFPPIPDTTQEGRRPPAPPARECADTPWTPRPKPVFLVERWLPKPMLGEKEGGGGEFSGYRVPPAHFGLVGRAFFPFRAFSPRLRGPSRAPSRPPKLPTNTPSSFASPTRRGGVLVYKQSLLMLVARAHKAKTASYSPTMQVEKRVLYR